MKVYGIIYLIRNKVNGKCYIGQTIGKGGFGGRYKHNLAKNTHNQHLKNSIQKYGIENFEIIEEFDVAYSKEELNKLEYMYVKIYDLINPKYGYNKKEGGGNNRLSEETKQKISNSLVEKMGGENNPMYGKHRFGEESPCWGRVVSEEQKQRQSEVMKGKYKGSKNPRAKAVWCKELQEVRLCGADWAIELNLNKSALIGCCRGRRKSTGGYHFRYATEKEVQEYKNKINRVIDK